VTVTAHPIDTGAASRWSLVGHPAGVRRYADTGEVAIFVQRSFVQRSFMRGRPWLRFSLRFEITSPADAWHVTAFSTREAALHG
jgi:hypothetical protein